MIIILLICSILYSLSIFIDVLAYHLKLNLRDDINMRYIFSVINIFQFSARGFVLLYAPLMAYLSENIRDQNLVWWATLLCQIVVIIFLFPTFISKYTLSLSYKVFNIINTIVGKKHLIEFHKPNIQYYSLKDIFFSLKSNVIFFVFSFISGIVFSFSITFIYYFSFFYKNNVLMMSSISQFLNMFGSMSILLKIDPIIMKAIDRNEGLLEIYILTFSRILGHIFLIIILLVVIK